MSLLNSEFVKLLLTVLYFLEVLQGSSEFSQVLPKSLVFKGKIINFSLLLLQVICDTLVFCVEIELSLDSMIFFI